MSAKSAGASRLVPGKNNSNSSNNSRTTRFVADSMLGSVARKLRIFGFDTLYVVHVADSEVLRIGVEQDRVILTADKEFFKRIVKAKARGVLVGGSDELEDLVHILRKNDIRMVNGMTIGTESRCAICNGRLATVNAFDVQGRLPEKVAQRHDNKNIYRCEACGKLYWEGSHIRRIRQLARNIDLKLQL
ncbi:MAG TPA: Mut7-C RNAse domain-containing protein [Nitrososphaera sp.]|nr:Mut7-C RNAse domain-containing protein [Nitrososphaera sp.]